VRSIESRIFALLCGVLCVAACVEQEPELTEPMDEDEGVTVVRRDMPEDIEDMEVEPEDMAPRDTSGLPYASRVVDFSPGRGAGFGQSKMPGVVLGPPEGKGPGGGSLDVVSLGVGGSITLEFGEAGIVDGEGPDFVVFENPFWVRNDPMQVYAELAQVSVSEDGETWSVFPCEPSPNDAAEWPGCAGWTPTLAYDPFEIVPLDWELTGGDAFDLADVGVERARFVKIEDLETDTTSPTSAGFDLDAVGVVR